MEDLNLDDNYLIVLTTGIVASIRKKFPKIDGLLYVSITIFVISLAACLVRYFGKGEAFTWAALAVVVMRAIWISILSLAGVNALSYLLEKNGTKNVGTDKNGN